MRRPKPTPILPPATVSERDYLAGLALASLRWDPITIDTRGRMVVDVDGEARRVARAAYAIADAMLRERRKRVLP